MAHRPFLVGLHVHPHPPNPPHPREQTPSPVTSNLGSSPKHPLSCLCNFPCHASVTFCQFFSLSRILFSLLTFSLPSSLSTRNLSLSCPTSSSTLLAPVTDANTVPCNTSVHLSHETMSSLRTGVMSILFIGEQYPAHKVP